MNPLLNELKFSLVAHLCSGLIRLVGLTSKINYIRPEILEDFLFQKKPFILAFWHNRQFFLAYPKAHHGISVLVSQSKDGEYIARAVKNLGINSIRGSSSRGGVKALTDMMRILRKGGKLAITPDGPRGPIFEVQPGVIHIAQKTGVAIIPACCSYARKKIFKSWDLYQVPSPFNKIFVSYGTPLYFSKEETFETASQRIKKALDELTQQTDLLAEKK